MFWLNQILIGLKSHEAMLVSCIPVMRIYKTVVFFLGGGVFSLYSGGVERSWTGVPRKLFSPGSSGVRCVCVEDPSAAEEDPNLLKYDGCPPNADSCFVEEF